MLNIGDHVKTTLKRDGKDCDYIGTIIEIKPPHKYNRPYVMKVKGKIRFRENLHIGPLFLKRNELELLTPDEYTCWVVMEC